MNCKKCNIKIKYVLLIITLISTFFISLFLGRFLISPLVVIKTFGEIISQINCSSNSIETSVIANIRLPRTILSMLVGAGLSISGATFQGIFKNPLVSPDILGVNAGAAFGAVLAILFCGLNSNVTFYAILFGIISVCITYMLSKNKESGPVLSLVLSGIIVSSVFSSLISLIKYVADPYDKLPTITYWLMGSFSKCSYDDLKFIFLPITVSIILLLMMRWRINILSLGDEEAHSLGIDPKKIRLIIIALVTIITACSVTIAGIIGWVGLVIPHISRIMFGVDHSRLLPVSCIIGAIFLTLVDIIARTATSVEIPIGILTALIGAPFFGWLIKKKNKGDWA
ncbi:FecCD family ABC transporter permease [Clostridium lundense]|uniref:FecCD family ABC transporter permease n=1 Tax=Clostridium lundense TaxID=319475 RepID=UPI000483631D|nr:iron ABC transporter permease [Clostridium lundense]